MNLQQGIFDIFLAVIISGANKISALYHILLIYKRCQGFISAVNDLLTAVINSQSAVKSSQSSDNILFFADDTSQPADKDLFSAEDNYFSAEKDLFFENLLLQKEYHQQQVSISHFSFWKEQKIPRINICQCYSLFPAIHLSFFIKSRFNSF
ncbi:MAG: hypothetical protein N4A74_24385 [Carboxylicivirga sp.]|nr:hypothetical protein [Carboxylicivirga sp.]